MAQDMITVRTDSELKKRVALKAEKLGMNTTTAINIFLRAFDRSNGMPFDVTLDYEGPEERAEINRILEERTMIANDPDTKWMTSEEVRKSQGL